MRPTATIDAAGLLSRELNPLTYYDILPSDRPVLTDVPSLPPRPALYDALMSRSAAEADDLALDRTLLACLVAPQSWASTDLQRLAEHATLGYAKLLCSGKSLRSRRMKLQQLNYFCRDILSSASPEGAAAILTTEMNTSPPWDWLPVPGGEITVVSGAGGVRWTIDRRKGSADCAMASQVDAIDATRYSVGSIFSSGCYIWEASAVRPIEHDRPIVLLFDWSGKLMSLDYDGCVRAVGSDEVRARLPVEQVDRARFLGTEIIASDWTRPKSAARLDLERGAANTISLHEILLLNDICAVGSNYFAVCKQQGKVFKLDRNFRATDHRLAFGRGPGRLFDPLTIRHDAGKLHVISWVTATRVTLPLF